MKKWKIVDGERMPLKADVGFVDQEPHNEVAATELHFRFMAPVFDTGSCLWSNAELLEVLRDYEYMAKPFKDNGVRPADQVRLFAGHFGWFDPAMLAGYPGAVGAILSKNPNIPEWRVEKVVAQVRKNAA